MKGAPVNHPEAAKRIQRAKVALLGLSAFYGAICFQLPLIENGKIETMQTDGGSIEYSPDYVMTLREPELIGVLAHEIAHITQLHHVRMGERDLDLWNQAADYAINRGLIAAGFTLPQGVLIDSRFSRNMAAESIYLTLERERRAAQKNKSGQGAQSAGAQASGQAPGSSQQNSAGGDPGQAPGQGSPAAAQSQGGQSPAGQAPAAQASAQAGGQAPGQGAQSPGGQGSGGQAPGTAQAAGQGGTGGQAPGGQGTGSGSPAPGGQASAGQAPGGPGQAPGTGSPGSSGKPHNIGGVIAPKGGAAGQADALARAQVLIRQAAAIAKGQGAGSVPGYVAETIESLNSPVISWREILREFATDSMRRDTNWNRPNKRFLGESFYFPGTKSTAAAQLVLILDSSYSMDTAACRAGLSEFQEILDIGAADRLTILMVDTGVRSVHEFEPGDSIEIDLTGRGGTKFAPAFEWIADNAPDCAAAVYVTDLDCDDFGPAPAFPVLWGVTSPQFYERVVPPFGDKILIDPAA